MTMQETSEQYHIPMEVLEEYENWALRKTDRACSGEQLYDDTDLRLLSMIMTLHDIGFSEEEAETYMRLLLKGDGTAEKRLAMLNQKRKGTLDEIHLKEKQLDYLDYLRHEIKR